MIKYLLPKTTPTIPKKQDQESDFTSFSQPICSAAILKIRQKSFRSHAPLTREPWRLPLGPTCPPTGHQRYRDQDPAIAR